MTSLPTIVACVTSFAPAFDALLVTIAFPFCFSDTVDASFPFTTLEATVAAGEGESGALVLLLTETPGEATVEGDRGATVFCGAGFFVVGLAVDGVTTADLVVEVLTVTTGLVTADFAVTVLAVTGAGDAGLAAVGLVAVALAVAVVESTGLVVVILAEAVSIVAAVTSTGLAVVGLAVGELIG